MEIPPPLRDRLESVGQGHVFRFWNQLSDADRRLLCEQLARLDISPGLENLSPAAEFAVDDLADRIKRAEPPSQLIPLPRTKAEEQLRRAAIDTGNALLRQGAVGAVLVAGGQGTRLGHSGPKGTYEIGPVTRKSLYQLLSEQLLARSRRAGVSIPLFVMTSFATDAETKAFFESHAYFGLEAADVVFFSQADRPSLDAASGKMLMAKPHEVATNPNGHGGMFEAIVSADLLTQFRERGLRHLFYMQVDNPLIRVCDPAFLGFHVERCAEYSMKIVPKINAQEAMGVVIEVDGCTQMIEYFQMTDAMRNAVNVDGSLRFGAGNIATHVFDIDFVKRIAMSDPLPLRKAIKDVSCVDEAGISTNRQAVKLERFVFDSLPRCERVLVMEADRAREFAPVKNATGNDTPDSCRRAMQTLHRSWLAEYGVRVSSEVPVEISPLTALESDDLTGVDVAAMSEATSINL